MIKDPEKYPKGRNGIKTTARITVICDHCFAEWQTQYSNYKSKKLLVDLCQSCKNKSGICGMLGKEHKESVKKHFSKTRAKERNPFYGKKHSDEQKQKWSEYRKNRPCRSEPVSKVEKEHRSKVTKTYWDNLSEEEKHARLSHHDFSNLTKSLLSNGGRYSGLHQKVVNKMKIYGLKGFQSEKRIGDYVVDELCKTSNIVIEVNGDYWHANPFIYKPDDIISYPKGLFSAASIWEKDEKRISEIKSMGYKVYIIWESDLKSNTYKDIFEEIKREM